MTTIMAIDPGPEQSGWVLYAFDGYGKHNVLDSGVDDNQDLLKWVKHGQRAHILAIEMMFASGMPAGNDHFRTLVWVGRFQQAWRDPDRVKMVNRREVKLEICGDSRAKDSNIRQALIDRVGAPGTKKAPGPTHGVVSHAWAALAVAVTAAQSVEQTEMEQA
jgi:hypothetical protein